MNSGRLFTWKIRNNRIIQICMYLCWCQIHEYSSMLKISVGSDPWLYSIFKIRIVVPKEWASLATRYHILIFCHFFFMIFLLEHAIWTSHLWNYLSTSHFSSYHWDRWIMFFPNSVSLSSHIFTINQQIMTRSKLGLANSG